MSRTDTSNSTSPFEPQLLPDREQDSRHRVGAGSSPEMSDDLKSFKYCDNSLSSSQLILVTSNALKADFCVHVELPRPSARLLCLLPPQVLSHEACRGIHPRLSTFYLVCILTDFYVTTLVFRPGLVDGTLVGTHLGCR